MCDCWKTKETKYLSLEKLKPIINDLKKLNAGLIMVSGGEPLQHPQIIDILKYIKEIGLKCSLNTNGILLNKKLDKISPLIDYMVISLDASNKELYKEIRGSDSFNIVIDNIKMIKSRYPNIKLEIRTTLMRKNIFDFHNILSLAKNLGLDGVGISPADYDSKSFGRQEINKQKNIDLLIPSLEELDQWENFIKNKPIIKESFKTKLINWNDENFLRLINFYRKIRKNSFDILENELCFFPHTSLLIDYEGELKNCFYSETFATLDDYNINQITSQDNLINLENQKKCFNCRGRVFT